MGRGRAQPKTNKARQPNLDSVADDNSAELAVNEQQVSDLNVDVMAQTPPKSPETWDHVEEDESDSDNDIFFPARRCAPKGIYLVMEEGILTRPSFLGHPNALKGVTTKADRRGNIEFMQGRDPAEWIVFGELAGQFEGCQMGAMGDRITRKPPTGVFLFRVHAHEFA